MGASSWLAYSWEAVDIVQSARGLPLTAAAAAEEDEEEEEEEHREKGGSTIQKAEAEVGITRSRRDEFRSNPGPCRETLLWSQILSILCKIRSPSCVQQQLQQQQSEKSENKSECEGFDAHAGSELGESRSGLKEEEVVPCAAAENGSSPKGHGILPYHANCRHAPSPLSPIPTEGNWSQCHSSASLCFPTKRNPSEAHLEALLQSVLWISSVVRAGTALDATLKVSWGDVPDSADPMRGSGYKLSSQSMDMMKHEEEEEGRQILEPDQDEHCSSTGQGGGDCLMGRGERKRLQVENIASVLSTFQFKAGSKVVDFGCGSGALTLPLAALFPDLLFVGVDFKEQSISLLKEKAQRAKLHNVVAFHGRIETFSEPFDACVALHACGIATDLAHLQALKNGAAYVMSPCCVGKLQIPIQKVVQNSAQHMTSRNSKLGSQTNSPPPLKVMSPTCKMDTFGMAALMTLPGTGDDNTFLCKSINGPAQAGNTRKKCLTLDSACSQPDRRLPLPHNLQESVVRSLAYPRSRWLRGSISENEYQLLARAADWSSYDRDSAASRLRSLCKIILELDRNEASQELGYKTELFSLSNEKAGTVGISHVLVGVINK